MFLLSYCVYICTKTESVSPYVTSKFNCISFSKLINLLSVISNDYIKSSDNVNVKLFIISYTLFIIYLPV